MAELESAEPRFDFKLLKVADLKKIHHTFVDIQFVLMVEDDIHTSTLNFHIAFVWLIQSQFQFDTLSGVLIYIDSNRRPIGMLNHALKLLACISG